MPLERLSVLDASFLERETPVVPLHVGGIGVFGGDLRFDRVLSTLEARIGDVVHGRKRVLPSPAGGGRPVWVDDVDFDLSYHLRHSALPPPGSAEQLYEFLARLMARPLDRTRPLWEVYVVEGLADGHVAVFRKVHLAMAGGDRGDPFGVLLDSDDAVAAVTALPRRYEPRPVPSSARLVAAAARDLTERVGEAGAEAARLASDPRRLAGTALSAVGDAAGLVARAVRSAPRSPLNRTLGQHRRLATARLELEHLREIRRAFGGTINDAVVAVASDAVGRLLRWRGHDTKDLDLRVMVPVRTTDQEEQRAGGLGTATTLGDGVVGVLAPLPVMAMDPVARLYRIMGELAGLKASRQAVAAENLVRLAGFAPANLHALAARLASAEQRYNVALSNAPGPQAPRYLAGVPMRETYPFLPLAGDCALSIAVTSYTGGVYVGLVGEREGMADLDELAEFLTEAAGELHAAAVEAVG